VGAHGAAYHFGAVGIHGTRGTDNGLNACGLRGAQDGPQVAWLAQAVYHEHQHRLASLCLAMPDHWHHGNNPLRRYRVGQRVHHFARHLPHEGLGIAQLLNEGAADGCGSKLFRIERQSGTVTPQQPVVDETVALHHILLSAVTVPLARFDPFAGADPRIVEAGDRSHEGHEPPPQAACRLRRERFLSSLYQCGKG